MLLSVTFNIPFSGCKSKWPSVLVYIQSPSWIVKTSCTRIFVFIGIVISRALMRNKVMMILVLQIEFIPFDKSYVATFACNPA
ncbi:hypothetical protein VNO78_25442 [Psophocarpus tetragonolobus]|uniref:Uncharacterized protein n=1 Tax=Psophocarpus tetragonolobus TaxID=3891 RepID=A0AAN9S6G2_PSOTE